MTLLVSRFLQGWPAGELWLCHERLQLGVVRTKQGLCCIYSTSIELISCGPLADGSWNKHIYAVTISMTLTGVVEGVTFVWGPRLNTDPPPLSG